MWFQTEIYFIIKATKKIARESQTLNFAFILFNLSFQYAELPARFFFSWQRRVISGCLNTACETEGKRIMKRLADATERKEKKTSCLLKLISHKRQRIVCARRMNAIILMEKFSIKLLSIFYGLKVLEKRFTLQF